MTFAVGLTGNLASGKTTCATIFSSFGIAIINADEVARQLTLKDTPAYKKIIEHLGSKIVDDQGDLNRKQLRELIFQKAEERLWLENLLHPLIRQEIETRVGLCSTPYCMVEIPLLFSRDAYPYLNEILVIIAPRKLQISRVMERDHCSKEQALAILAIQPKTSERIKIADNIIKNDSGIEDLKLQLKQLHEDYLQKACSSGHPDNI